MKYANTLCGHNAGFSTIKQMEYVVTTGFNGATNCLRQVAAEWGIQLSSRQSIRLKLAFNRFQSAISPKIELNRIYHAEEMVKQTYS
jgi:hypothetical protein